MLSTMVQCNFCPDYIPRVSTLSTNEAGDADMMGGDFDDVYDGHMAQHEHLMFSCEICKSARLVSPIFINLSEVLAHMKTYHDDVRTNLSKDIIYPIDFRRAKCRQCSQEILASGRRPVVLHLLDHEIEFDAVDASDNQDFLLGCRICDFTTTEWEPWKEHFISARYLCKGSRIEKIRDEPPEPEPEMAVVEPKPKAEKSVHQKEEKTARSYYCGWCETRFFKARDLQDHFTGADHARTMTKSRSAAVTLLCNICNVDVSVANFLVHVRSDEHRTALRKRVLMEEKGGSKSTKTKVDRKVFMSKYVWKRVDNKDDSSSDSDVQIVENKTDGNQNVLGGGHRASNAALFCGPCKVQSHNQAEYEAHTSNMGHQLKVNPPKNISSIRKLMCPFCDRVDIDDLGDHVFRSHRGNMFICSLCDSEVAIYMDVLHTHLEKKHPNLFLDLDVTLPANLMFHVCQRCHMKGKTLEGAHVEKAMVGGRDPDHRCHGSRAGLVSTPLLVECRVCQTVFKQLLDYCNHECYKTLKGCYIVKLQTLIDLTKKPKVLTVQL